ncbi:MAG: hypothetical protein JSU81_03290, partial [Candidatus Coatesbacteria bacterium]
MKIARALVVVATLIPVGASAAAAESSRTVWEKTAEGLFAVVERGSPATAATEPRLFVPPEVIWTHNEPDTIYLTTAFGNNGRHIFAGSRTNDCAAQLFAVAGSGNYNWEVVAGTAVYTAAARDADAFAAGFTGGTANDVKFFRSGSSTPVWTYTPGSGETVRGPVALPADGSFV